MKTRVSSKGQVVLPVELLERDHIVPVQQFEIERIQAGEYVLRRTTRPGQPGLVRWLRDCPEGGWFQPILSESTDTLGAP
jgi:bifunctional DNA-binding transcriptional regulator/antitoxin component of YhaV-PrlF toxin-antitoxin module